MYDIRSYYGIEVVVSERQLMIVDIGTDNLERFVPGYLQHGE